MTLYTKYRGYPYPRDAKEAGNGGLHSQLLAEAIARDLDNLDAAWALEQQRPLMMATKSGNQSVSSGIAGTTVNNLVVEREVGVTVENAGWYRAKPGAAGWYHVLASVRARATGTITAGAMHRIELKTYSINATGNLDYVESRYRHTFQTGSGDVFVALEDMIYLSPKVEMRWWYGHTNTGSAVNILGTGTAVGTRITLTKIVGD